MTLVLYFTADYCKPCKTFGPMLAQAVADHNLTAPVKIDIIKIDVMEEAEEAQKYNVAGLPTVVRLDNDIETGRTVGANTYENIVHDLHLTRKEA